MRALLTAAFLVSLAGCVAPQPATPAAIPAARATPRLGSGTWRSFSLDGYCEGLVRVRNGDFWVACSAYPSSATLSLITRKGKITTHSIGVYPQEMAIDDAGNFWLTTARNEEQIAELDPRFNLKTFQLSGNAYGGIIVGKDGNIWFPESFAVGTITPNGQLTEYQTPEVGGESGITWSHGLVWFFLTSGLASINPHTGALGVHSALNNQGALIAAADGALWYFGTVQRRQYLVRFDPMSNKSAKYEMPRDFAVPWTPGNLDQTPDGAIWYGAQHIAGRKIRHQDGAGLVRFDPKTKTFTTYRAPKAYGWPWNVAGGLDGTVWATAAYAAYERKPSQ